MKKYRLFETGEEVKLGDRLAIEALITEETLNDFIEEGVIEEYEEITIPEVINHLGVRKGINSFEFINILNNINKKATFIVLAKEVALIIDDRYEGHIKYSDELWGINTETFEPLFMASGEDVENSPIDKYAAFRSKKDVLEAISILQPLIKDY